MHIFTGSFYSSQVVIHSNNHYTKDVRIFRHAEIFYSIGGKYFPPQSTKVNFQQDDYFENARPVILRMQNKIGRFVRIDLYFQARWIMISEVSFTSSEWLMHKGLTVVKLQLSATNLVTCSFVKYSFIFHNYL